MKEADDSLNDFALADTGFYLHLKCGYISYM